jgi:hypothetical protein
VSASSEFDRHLGNCIDFLEASDFEGAYALATRLLEARAIAKDDLTTAARRVLSIAAAEPAIAAIDFPSPPEAEAFRAVCDPMLELSRVIAGVPADPGPGR